MRRVTKLCCFLLALPWAAALYAQPEPLAGHWAGAMDQPAGALEITVDVAADSKTGTFSLPASAVFEWPTKVTTTASSVQFKLPNGLILEGQVRAGKITGKIGSPTGGHIDVFTLTRTPAPSVPYRKEDVTFESGGVTLTGTLRLPRTEGRHAAIMMLQGSGDADREAEAFYADYFARRGIATLVYDKRGTGNSGGDYRDESFDDFAADALAGVHYLQSRKDIDPRRVGLRGRSHGGIVAPLAASLSRDVAFIINVSGAGVPPYRQMTYQTTTEMRRDGFSDGEIAEATDYLNLKWEIARAGGAGWDKLEAATRKASGKKWLARVHPATKPADIVPSWKLQMAYDPMPTLEKVTCPVLAIFGELDTSTPVAETIANYQAGLSKAGNRDVTIKVFPNADHALLVWPKAGDKAHWPVLAPGYLDAMGNWVDRHIASK